MFSKRSRVTCAAVLVGVTSLLSGSCLNRPVVSTEPETSNIFVDLTTNRTVDKIDLLFMIDNSGSMSDKQEILRLAVPQLLGRLLDPWCADGQGNSVASNAGSCPAGYALEFQPVDDIHIGVISSSLGSPGTDACSSARVAQGDDGSHLLGLTRTRPDGTPLHTYQGLGFLAWDPHGKKQAQGLPPGESDPAALIRDFQELVVATGESGCGYEASLESWYRFLVDPDPPASWQVEGDVARPVGTDTELLEERRQFLRPDSLLAIIMLSDENDCSLNFEGDGWFLAHNEGPNGRWFMPRGTSVCETNPRDPCCRPCNPEPDGPPAGCSSIETDPVCSQAMRHDADSDPPNLRCFEQKRRFGVERLYPVERYVRALRSPTVTGRDGIEHPNPLFTDLKTGAIASRTSDLVFLAGIVGVPWQDIATPGSLGAGAEHKLDYLDSQALQQAGVWSQILGDSAGQVPPGDPLMRESVMPRQGTTPGGVPLAPPNAGLLANPINGHEYDPKPADDLQYACIFPLATPVPCAKASCECSKSSETLDPLCQQNDGSYSDVQRYAKAYPGLRQLAVLQGAGDSGIVASICPKLEPPTDASAAADPNVGYNPAVAAIVDSIGTKLGGKCVPRQLTPDDETRRVPCAMVEALPRDASGQCEPCSSIRGRQAPNLRVARAVRGQLDDVGRCRDASCEEYCLCEIQQAEGADLTACQTDPSASTPGYCYIDAEAKVGDPALVQDCPNQRGLRFVGDETPRNGAQTFIACVGAAFGDAPASAAGP